MAFVEHLFPELYWGHKLAVKREGDRLLVGGLSPISPPEESSRDFLKEFRAAPKDWSKKHSGKDLPHVQFANAESDAKLTAFVKQFGPVVVTRLRVNNGEHPIRVVAQDMHELCRERIVYRAALELVSELAKDSDHDPNLVSDCVLKIAEGVQAWPEQWDREQQMRGSYSEPVWHFDELARRRMEVLAQHARQSLSDYRSDYLAIFTPAADPIEAGHLAVCGLVNAFRPKVFRCGGNTLEGPGPDLSYGIRPLLYYILRRAYLGEKSIAICANERCREVFEINRHRDRFCTPRCSQLQRQREYWVSKGKARRSDRKQRRKSPAPKAGAKQRSGSSKASARFTRSQSRGK